MSPDTLKYFQNNESSFPLFEKAIQFYNHPEVMVRNAIRIIALNVFKCNEEMVNESLGELPKCSYFVNIALQFRDKIVDLDQC